MKRLKLLLLVSLLLACLSAASCQQEHQQNSTAGADQLHQSSHKTLVPISGLDIALFIVIAVALFIASGAGVGGGVLVVPALLIIGQFNAVTAVALSNVTILASAVANMLFNLPRSNPARAGPIIDWDLVLLLGPPTVIGSIGGSYVTMVLPSWVTKVTLFLLLVPMAWRMVDKARLLYRKETAARKASAKEACCIEAADAEAAVVTTAALAAAKEATGTAVLAVGAAAAPAAPPPPAAAPITKDAGVLPAELEPHTAVSVLGPLTDLGHTNAHAHNPLARLSATLSSAVHSELGDLFGPDLAYLDDEHDWQPAAGPSPHMTPAATGDGLRPPRLHLAAAAASPTAHQVPSLPVRSCAINVCCWQSPAGVDCEAFPQTCDAVRAQLTREATAQLPLLQVGLLAGILAAVAGFNLAAGFSFVCGSWQYWLLALAPVPLMVVVWWVMRRHVLWKTAWKRCLELSELSELRWTARTTVLYPAICITAGIIAGMLGLGGGLVLTPLMLELGVSAPVSAASTQVTLLISSSTSAIVYAVAGSVPWGYGVVLVVVGFLATLLGQWLVSELVRRLGRNSILVIILAVMFSAATAAALAVVVMTIIDLARHPAKLTAHKSVCPT